MNTIQITSKTDVNGAMLAAVTYTEAEVLRFIEKVEEVDKLSDKIRDVKYKVRDFFSELEWENSEATITRSEVNELLKAIGCNIIRGKYKANVTITAYVTGYSADDADDAADCIADDISVSIGSTATVNVDEIKVDDVEEDD